MARWLVRVCVLVLFLASALSFGVKAASVSNAGSGSFLEGDPTAGEFYFALFMNRPMTRELPPLYAEPGSPPS